MTQLSTVRQPIVPPVKPAVRARSAVVVQRSAVAVDVESQSKSDPAGFLATIFTGLIVEGFRFEAGQREGKIGLNMISKPLFVSVKDAEDQLALHLNFMVTPSQYLGDRKLKLKIEGFHMTARPKKGQVGIDFNGPSILTAEESIHINKNTSWGKEKNLGLLAIKLDVKEDVILKTLASFEGYNQTYMSYLVKRLQEAIIHTVGVNAGGIDIVFEGDKTWE